MECWIGLSDNNDLRKMKEIRVLSSGINKSGTSLRILRKTITDISLKTIKNGFSRIQENNLLLALRKIDSAGFSCLWGIEVKRSQQPIKTTRFQWPERKEIMQVAFNVNINKWCRIFQEATYIARK